MTTPCPACGTPKPCRHYLCAPCWDQLPDPTRRALNRRDGKALTRLRQLHHHIDRGRPLANLEITP